MRHVDLTGLKGMREQENNNMNYSKVLGRIAIVGLAVLAATIVAWLSFRVIRNAMAASHNGFDGAVFLGAFAALLGIGLLVWRILLVVGYRSLPAPSDDALPAITVIVPAYNEGAQVLRALESVVASNYPHDRLQIIAIDDGSQDDTWRWIRRAVKRFAGRIEPVRFAENRGKRHGLSEGFRRGTGEIFVTIDSDSEIEPDTLRNLVAPFADEKVGAVAGNVRVLARQRHPIARMLDVLFVQGFDFRRAAESRVNTVVCTPGALSAYRANVVDKLHDEWLGQTFWGRPAAAGEDRALTNMILREGYDVRFQRNAVVHTEVPETFATLSRMLLRWERSNVRESLIMLRFAFRRFREGKKSGARINLLDSMRQLAQAPVIMVAMLGGLFVAPGALLLALLIGGLLRALIPGMIYLFLRPGWGALWAIPTGVFWTLLFFWLIPLAMITPHLSGWLTRQLPRPVVVAPRTAKVRNA
jgi:hyaluronan synthase